MAEEEWMRKAKAGEINPKKKSETGPGGLDLRNISVKTYVTKMPPKKAESEPLVIKDTKGSKSSKTSKDSKNSSKEVLSMNKKLTALEQRIAYEYLPPELIRPEMITLRKRKKKLNNDDEIEYEDVSDDENKAIPTIKEMQCEDYYR